MPDVISSPGPVDTAALAAQLLSNAMPKSEATAAAAGTGTLASRDTHTHPRISWSGLATTNGSGVATFDFSSKPFATQPVVIATTVETGASQQPVVLKVSSWTMDAQNRYVGCTVQAYRSRVLPTNLLALLTAVFDIFNAPASGVQVDLVLLPQTIAT